LARKTVPQSPTSEGETSGRGSAAEGLFTAQDLFGDLVDAPLEASEQPLRGSGRVKVQVAEKNKPEPPPEKKAADIASDEMAGLVDAFGDGPSTVAAESRPEHSRTSASSISADAGEVDSLLGNLGPMVPPEPKPKVTLATRGAKAEAAATARGAEDFGSLLENIGETPSELPPGIPTETASLPVPELPSPLEELAESGSPAEAEEADMLAALEAPTREPDPVPTRSEANIDDLLSSFLDAAPQRPPSGPADKPRTKLKVEAPRVSRETIPMLDLGALADEALAESLAELSEPEKEERAGRPLSPPASFGPYRLLERIAAGGMAEVFRAKRTGVEGFEKVLAVKRILPHLSDNKEFVEMFVDEAKMVAGLTHPNIVQIFDLGKIDATYFIAMEYVHGKDLRTILKRAKERGLRIPLDLSVLVVSKVCSALEYAHRKRDEQGEALKIVHRDISPQNILISFEGEVKLTDFGIAKATSKASSTDRGALRGKLLYMSPEQASGHPMDRRSDVFSLGVVFYEMITDTKPFLGSSEKGILEMVRDCRVERPRSLNPKIPESLEKVVTKALEKDPERRYQDASEMYRGLERVLRERQPPAATELARFMEVLFETGSVPDRQTEPADDGIEIDLSPAEPATPLAVAEEESGDEDIDLDDLLKRISK
jgi:serine/threonine protein kinase